MITLDTSTFIVLIVVAALGGALLGVLPAWLRLAGGMRELPLWGFVRHADIALDPRTAFQAELRCEMCDSQRQCRQLLARGERSPVADCPNAALFSPAASRTPAAPKG